MRARAMSIIATKRSSSSSLVAFACGGDRGVKRGRRAMGHQRGLERHSVHSTPTAFRTSQQSG